MISALVGSVIMSGVTVAMLLAINITDKALIKVGKYSLIEEERQILIDAGYEYKTYYSSYLTSSIAIWTTLIVGSILSTYVCWSLTSDPP